MLSFLYVYSDHSILECYYLFSGVELSMRSFFVIYGVYISQLIRYARCCSHYDDFRYHHKCLVDRLLSQGYKALRLEKSFKKFYGRYQDLIEKYRRSVNAMVSDSSQDNFYLTCSRNLVAFVIYMDLSLRFVYT